MYYVYTERYKLYKVNDKMQIIRTDMELLPSNNWTAVCLVDRYNHKLPFSPGKYKYKNGKGKVYLVDKDHNKFRIWGDRIVEIVYIKE